MRRPIDLGRVHSAALETALRNLFIDMGDLDMVLATLLADRRDAGEQANAG